MAIFSFLVSIFYKTFKTKTCFAGRLWTISSAEQFAATFLASTIGLRSLFFVLKKS